MKYKEFEVAKEERGVKHFGGSRPQVRSIDLDNHEVEVLVSDRTRDRYDEVIEHSAWRKRLGNYKRHPVFLQSHEYSGSLLNQIGHASSVKVDTEEGLIANFKYYVGQGNQEADWGWFLATQKKAAFSVGFMVHKYEVPEAKEEPRRVYTDVELLEISQVLIPANPSAVQAGIDQGVISKEFADRILEAGQDQEDLEEAGEESGIEAAPEEENIEDRSSVVDRLDEITEQLKELIRVQKDLVELIQNSILMAPAKEEATASDSPPDRNGAEAETDPVRKVSREELMTMTEEVIGNVLQRKFGVFTK